MSETGDSSDIRTLQQACCIKQDQFVSLATQIEHRTGVSLFQARVGDGLPPTRQFSTISFLTSLDAAPTLAKTGLEPAGSR